jgi:hypothetical protein
MGIGSGPGREPVLLEPGDLGGQGLAAVSERPEHRADQGAEVGVPAALAVGLDMAGSKEVQAAQGGQVDLLAVNRRFPRPGN